MKQSEGFSRLVPSLITIAAMIASFALLSLSMKMLPLGTAYTIWTGIGAVGAFLVGVVILGEPVNMLRSGKIQGVWNAQSFRPLAQRPPRLAPGA
ncbi:multidrug efflux SMR transporter, partial [Novosphingobium sp.]|uniref:DMT family transporter n=1 Tax=Novosphingobium sp. TaxID=1874826 RepID=UPI0028ADC478